MLSARNQLKGTVKSVKLGVAAADHPQITFLERPTFMAYSRSATDGKARALRFLALSYLPNLLFYRPLSYSP